MQYTWINLTMLHLPHIRLYDCWIPWSYKGLPFAMPFMNAFLFNFVQVVFVIFICSNDLCVRSRETVEALYVRPVSNVKIVMGRNAGKLVAVTLLNFLSMGGALFFNILYSGYAFNGSLYLFYWLTLTFPTLVFILGLSNWLGQVVKHQGLFILLVLSIVGAGILFLATRLEGFLDPFAREIPNVFSDITGHAGIVNYLLQRITIFLIGIVFIFLTVGFYPRLDNSVNTRKKTGVLVGGLLLVLMIPVVTFINRHDARWEQQAFCKSLQDRYGGVLVDHVVSQRIVLQEETHGFHAESWMRITRLTSSDSSLVLFLNPGLEVDALEQDGIPVTYSRTGQVLVTDLHLVEKDTVNLHVTYHGHIDGSVVCSDLPRESRGRELSKRLGGMYRSGTRTVLDLENYKSYSPASLWYPTCVIPSTSFLQVKDFTCYSLTVRHREGATVISQGIPEELKNDETIFHHAHALPGINLCIGNYNCRTIRVDSIRYNVYYFPGHEYFFERFGKVDDNVLVERIREIKQDIEYHKGNLSGAVVWGGEKRDRKYDRVERYPYEWLYLVETPISLYFFLGDQGEGERESCGLVSLPENLLTSFFWGYEEQECREDDSDLVFCSFLGDQECGLLASGPCSVSSALRGNTCFIASGKYPFIHETMSRVCKDIESLLTFTLDDNRKVNVINYLSKHSLQNAIESKLPSSLLNDIFIMKTAELKALIALQVDLNEFEMFYRDFLLRHLFEEVQLSAFEQEVKDSLGLELAPILEKWYKSDRLASFVVKECKVCAIYHDIFYSFKIFNQGEGDGVIITGDNQAWHIEAGAAVEIMSRKRMRRPDYLFMPLACNLPDVLSLKRDNTLPYLDTLAKTIEMDPREFALDSTEIIVDNEDPGFRIVKNDLLEKIFPFKNKGTGKKYGSVSRSGRWELLIDKKYFGNPIKSALVIGIGEGKHRVEWHTSLPDDGEYEVLYYYFPGKEYHSNKFADKESRSHEFVDNKRYFIVDDGVFEHKLEVELDPDGGEWISLGVFHFPKGRDVKVVLSDEGDINRYVRHAYLGLSSPKVVADAVKWKKCDK